MDLSFLRSLLENPGPFLSVYLDISDHDRGVDAQARQTRWRDLREQLANDDDGAGTLDAVGAALSAPENFGVQGVAAFGTHGRVPLVVKLPRVPGRGQAGWSCLPDLLPLLVQTPPRPPHLVVSANREGGQVLVMGGAANELKRRGAAGTGHRLAGPQGQERRLVRRTASSARPRTPGKPTPRNWRPRWCRRPAASGRKR